MLALKDLLNGQALDMQGDFINLKVEAPNARTTSGDCPLFYFGGLSEPAREVAAECSDVFLMWPDTLPTVEGILDDMRARATTYNRSLRFGYRVHVIVRETESAAIDASRELISKLDADVGDKIRAQSLDSQSVGVRAQGVLREAADDDGFVEDNLWTGIGRARSGCGAAIVGDPDQVLAKLKQYMALGIEAFILSGYPHEDECDLFARYVLPKLDHEILT